MKRREVAGENDNVTLNIHAVDLFCGVGGLTNGLKRAGIDVRMGVDIDPACQYPYEKNNDAKFVLKSVEDLTARELEPFFPEKGYRLLAGCAPCQTFSSYNQKARPSDERWWLLLQFSRIVRELKPELVTMENVPGLRRQGVFQQFVKELEDDEYHVSHDIFDCCEYGVPQNRERLVLLASKLGPIRMLTPSELDSKTISVREAIGDMPPLAAGESCARDPFHRCSKLSPTNLRRIRASRPGGTWRDWNENLVAKCHKKRSGKSYPSVYGRMVWEEPAPTLTTLFYGFGNGRFGHPDQDRAISLREGAMLQSFAPDYEFTPPGKPIHLRKVGRLIGNAVPVRLGEVIGASFIAHVTNHGSSGEKRDTMVGTI